MGEGTWLVAFLVVQRLVELGFAQFKPDGCAHRVALNSAYALPASDCAARLMAGRWLLGHDQHIVTFWLAVFVLLQMGRLWVIASLGRRWTTRVIVLRGAARVALGPYRWLKHPNYLIVALEIAVVPQALGLPVFARVFSIANAALLVHRIRIENEALDWAAQAARALKTPTLANSGSRR